MSEHSPDQSVAVVPVTPRAQTANIVVEEAGRAIIALLQKAAEAAKEDCSRALDTAHRLSFELRRTEERVREAEAELAHFRDRATRAEAWLLRIHNEAEQVFFQKKDRQLTTAPAHQGVVPPRQEQTRLED
jgi:hypothetical protein